MGVLQADIVSDEGEQQHQQESLDDAEDDPFSSVHKQQQQAKRQKCNGVSSPLSVASDEDTPVAAAAEEQRAGQAGTTLEHAAVLSSRAQELADRQRLIQAKLEQAKQLGKQEEEEEPGKQPQIIPHLLADRPWASCKALPHQTPHSCMGL